MNRLLKASKAKYQRNKVKINFGVKIPRDHKEAMVFDSDNVNTNWKDSELLEMKQIYNFGPFESLGTVIKARIPPGHTKIQVHIICDYKKDGRYKACMVDSGNMNGPNLDTHYSIVISLRSMRTVVLLDELNNIETCTGDISNTYMTEQTTEKIVFNAGPKFAPFVHAGHLMTINTSLYVFNSSSVRFHSQISDALAALGFLPSVVGCDIWMRN